MNKVDDKLDDKLDNVEENSSSVQNSSPAQNQVMNLVRTVLARWWVILVFAALGYAAALYSLSISEPGHTATAVLEIITNQRRLVGDELEKDNLSFYETMITISNKIVGPTQLKIVTNSAKIQSIKNAIPPAFSLTPKYLRSEQEMGYQSAQDTTPAVLLRMIKGSVKVKPREDTTLIDITVTHTDSDAAIAIADAIMDAYLDAEEARKTGGVSEAFVILREEANQASKELETAQRAIETYKSVTTTNGQLKEKHNELDLLKLRYKARHPKLIHATAAHVALRQRFRGGILAVSQVPSEREFWATYREQMNQYDQDIADADAGKQGVSGDITMAVEHARSGWLSLVQGALSARESSLQARITRKQTYYDTVSQRITEIDVAEESNDVKIMVAERAYASGNTGAVRIIRLGQGCFGGIMLGLGVAYLLGMIDYKIYEVSALEEATGLPCLAAIPSNKAFNLKQEWLNVLEAEPNSANAEAVRNLRASILVLGKAERHKTILITSSIPGEGKTTTASELAAAFALNDQKTILVDFDLRRPRVHTLFPYLDKSIGMSGILSGHIETPKAVQETKINGLHVILAGTKAPNPSELLHENEIDIIISKLSEYYDRIVIDTPPILAVSDTRTLVKHVHSVILVVRALTSPVGAILRTKELLVQANATIAGVVLNDMKRKRGSGGYKGYKGYGEYGGSGGYGGYYESDESDEDEKKG